MENHPLLKELLQLCSIHNVDTSKAYLTFEVYIELSEIKKIWDLQYHYNEEVKRFYLSGKKEKLDSISDIYIPVTVHEHISPEKLELFQKALCINQNRIYLIIRDADSSLTCYQVTKGLVKPDSPGTSKKKKELEDEKIKMEKNIQKYRKKIYSKALKSTF